MTTKPVVWLGSSLSDIRRVPAEARRELGHDLSLVESGKSPRDWKPLSSIGPGVTEIRVRAPDAYRVVFVAKFPEAVFVLHVFKKKSQKTAHFDIELARARFAALVRSRAGK